MMRTHWILLVVLLLGGLAAAPAAWSGEEPAATVELTIDCGLYRGAWRIPGVTRGDVRCDQEGQQETKVTLTRGEGYTLFPANLRTGFRIRVAKDGTVTVDPKEAGTLKDGVLTINTVPICIDSGAYIGGWRLHYAASRPRAPDGKNWCDERVATVHVPGGFTYPLIIANPPRGPNYEKIGLAVSRTGKTTIASWSHECQAPAVIANHNGVDCVTLSAVRVLVRTPKTISWAINGGNWSGTGAATAYLVPGISYWFIVKDSKGKQHNYSIRLPRNTALGRSSVHVENLPTGEEFRVLTHR